MGLGEKTPLRGSQEHVPYVFMTDPNRAYKKKVRQLQCYLCSAVLGIFAIALLVSVVYSVDNDDEDNDMNGTLALKLHSPEPHASSGATPESTGNGKLRALRLLEGQDNEETGNTLAQKSEISHKQLGAESCFTNGDGWFACNETKYRTSSGRCNNMKYPTSRGVSGRPFQRILPPQYCDGKSAPRCGSSGVELPPSISIGSKLIKLVSGKSDIDNNMVLVLWSKFLHQDIVDYQGVNKPCCGELKTDTNSCLPIEISNADPLFSVYNNTCLSFTRSPTVTCTNGQREQVNRATSYLDGSVLYGSNSGEEKKLRKFQMGQLVLYKSPENKYLPVSLNESKECEVSGHGDSSPCVNETISCISQKLNIPTINLMLARHHNNIASQLSIINPHWSDEQVFQEARRIVTAQIQHITYNEFLQSTLGPAALQTVRGISESGFEYDDDGDASTSNAFASAVFNVAYQFLPEITNNPTENNPCSILSFANQIQRGRDHGIPGYVTWRQHCGLGKASNFNDLAQDIGSETIKTLQEIYQDVDDIDLIVGVASENPSNGNKFGPVGACIISDQFKKLKVGDRFWYETALEPQKFNRGQLMEIQKSTLSRIICDQSHSLQQIQYNSMRDTADNPTILCSALPGLNLTYWQEDAMQQNPDDETSHDNDFMESGNRYVQRFMLQAKSKSNVTKVATSFTVNVANVTGTVGENTTIQMYYTKPPFTIPLDNIADTSAYTPAATVTFSATYEDDIVEGVMSLPIKSSNNFVKGTKKTLNLNFTIGVTMKWGGVFTFDKKRTFNCKLMFQSYAKLSASSMPMMKLTESSPLNLRADESGEQCNILLVGTYYSRPFYCSLTPWWCQEGTIFYWSGEAKLIFTKPSSPNVSNLKSVNPSDDNENTYMAKTQKQIGIASDFASITVLRGKVSGRYDGGELMTLIDGSPPTSINLTRLLKANSSDISLDTTFSATSSGPGTLLGQFSVPIMSGNDDSGVKFLTGDFALDVTYKFEGPEEVIKTSKPYNCKVVFHRSNVKETFNLKSSILSAKEKTSSGDFCIMIMVGTFSIDTATEKLFDWSGEIEVVTRSSYVTPANLMTLKSSIASSNNKRVFVAKTEDVVTEKSFASVTVVRAKITGLFNGEEPEELMNGSPPVEFNLENFLQPNAVDTSLQASWTAAVMDDERTIMGTFSLPYYPSVENYSERKRFTANFSLDVVYKYGGSLGIIDPSKTYSCKTMFLPSKKSTIGNLQQMPDSSSSVLGKTPFGESCSVTISGSFVERSVLCYLTPWWCSKGKIFRWDGDLEIALKYKYNASNTDTVKKLGPNSLRGLRKDAVIPMQKEYLSDDYIRGHRFGGHVSSGWIQVKTGEIFSGSTTIWSGQLPFDIKLPVFWSPTNDDGGELSDVYGHAVLWTASIFHSTISGTFSFPQYIGHGSPAAVKWIKGKFLFQIVPNQYLSINNLILSGVPYKSNIYFHNSNPANDIDFVDPKRGGPSPQDIGNGIRAPVILLGRYTPDKHFIWNGTFIIDVTRSAKDFYIG